MTKFSIHGWEHLSGDNPEGAEAGNEVIRQLDEVPNPHRLVWEKRLKSKLDHPHFSVRLEVYLHHFFKERGWDIEIEPSLPNTINRPDFVVRSHEEQVIIEAKTVLGAESERNQDHRLRQLADHLTGKINRTILIHPMLDIPSSLPNRRIALEIADRASEAELFQEFLVEGEHQGQQYSLEVTILLSDKPEVDAGVGGLIGEVVEVDVGRPVRRAILDKGGKYGEPHFPFVVAVWPKLPFHFSSRDDDDLVTLYGDKEWKLRDYPDRSSTLVSLIKPNGVYTLRAKGGAYRYSHISAVLFCHPDSIDKSPRLYHNPFAARPVNMNVFEGIPQCTIELATGKEQWTT